MGKYFAWSSFQEMPFLPMVVQKMCFLMNQAELGYVKPVLKMVSDVKNEIFLSGNGTRLSCSGANSEEIWKNARWRLNLCRFRKSWLSLFTAVEVDSKLLTVRKAVSKSLDDLPAEASAGTSAECVIYIFVEAEYFCWGPCKRRDSWKGSDVPATWVLLVKAKTDAAPLEAR